MMTLKTLNSFDRLLAPLSKRFSPELAQALADLQADESLQNQMDMLADKCTSGSLNQDEKEEYESLVTASAILSALKSRAVMQLEGK